MLKLLKRKWDEGDYGIQITETRTAPKPFGVPGVNKHKVMALNFNSKDELCSGGRLIKLSGSPKESTGPPSREALKTNVLRDTDVLDSTTGAGETSAGTFQPYIQLSCESTKLLPSQYYSSPLETMRPLQK